MCGIFGGIKNINLDKIKILGILNEERGIDSTGIFDNIKSTKAVLNFSYFSVDYFNSLKDHKNYIVGHTRMATTGKISERNAHPFTYGKITGVHNGVINNFRELKRKYNCEKMQCDSEIIFFLLDQKGIEGLKELKGYYAIVFKDSRKKDKLYFFKHNAEFSYIKTDEALYFSSDSCHLEMAFNEMSKIQELESNCLFEVDINSLEIQKLNKLDIIEPKKEKNIYYKKPKKEKNYDFNCPVCMMKLDIENIELNFCSHCHSTLDFDIQECFDCGSLFYPKQGESLRYCKTCEIVQKYKNRIGKSL